MKYAQIVEQIEHAIAEGRLAAGDRLPPERELAAEHGVSRMTVRQALQTLEARGLLRRTIGRSGGSFVARPKLERDLRTFSGLSEQLRRQGVTAGAHVILLGQSSSVSGMVSPSLSALNGLVPQLASASLENPSPSASGSQRSPR